MVKEVHEPCSVAVAQDEDKALSKEEGKDSRKKPDEVDLQEGETRSGEVGMRKMRRTSHSTMIGNVDNTGQRTNTHPQSRAC